MNYSKTLPATGAIGLGAAGYWGLVIVFITASVTVAYLHHRIGRIK